MRIRERSPNIAADPIGAVLILSGPPGETGSAPAILLRSDGSATALHAIPGADGAWSLSAPIEQLTPEKVRQCFLGMTAIRREAAQEIDRLIALLDRLGPDPDLEENGDNDADLSEEEPALGSVDNFTNQTHWHAGGTENLEGDEHDGGEPDEDGEPSLGSLNVTDQGGWSMCGNTGQWDIDVEDEHDGSEPSLGASEPIEPDPNARQYWGGQLTPVEYNAYDQGWWTHGCSDADREADAGDEREVDADFEPLNVR